VVNEPQFDPAPRSEGPRAPGSIVGRIAATLPILGLALVSLLALAWHDLIPGGWRLRTLFRPDAARQARQDAAHLADRLAEFASAGEAAPPGSVVFLGSSTMERFPLAELFPGKSCLGRGVANLTATNLLGNLPALLPRERPSGVVLYTGVVDWRASGRDEIALVQRVRAVLDAIAVAHPETPVALLGLLPERDMTSEAVGALQRANDRLAALAEERGLAFVDAARPPITDASGSLSRAMSVDEFHLAAEGYRHLALRLVEDGGAVGRLLAP
jgi:lysophospholipase L1-like esterase